MKRPRPLPKFRQRGNIESTFHDLANALTAARSFAEVIHLRSRAGKPSDPALVTSLLEELDRMANIVREVRQDSVFTGDILKCGGCGYTFVHRKLSGAPPDCRRCHAGEVRRWHPA